MGGGGDHAPPLCAPGPRLHIDLLTLLEAVGRAVQAAAEKKAHDLVVLEVGPTIAITDYFVLCSGTSDRQLRTIAEEIEAKLREDGRRALRSEGKAETGWILIDFGDFIVHVFSEEMRSFYDLERLWKDAPRPEIPELIQARQALG